jgi:hypothetical protein
VCRHENHGGLADAEKYERDERDEPGRQRVDRMESEGVEDVEPRCAVMHGVDAPQEAFRLVLHAMQPIGRQLGDEERGGQMDPWRTALRPERDAEAARDPRPGDCSDGDEDAGE